MMSTPAFRYAAALYRTGCPVERLCETADYLTDSPPLWEALCSPVVEVREKTAVLARLPSFTEDVRLQHFYALLAEKGLEPPVLALAEDGSAVVPLLGARAGHVPHGVFALRLLAQRLGRQIARHPARLMGLVEQAALRHCLLEYGGQICCRLRHGLDQRCAAIERCGRGALAIGFDARHQVANQLARRAERGRGRIRRSLAGSGTRTIGNKCQRQLAVAFGNFQFQRVAGLGGKRQGQRDIALSDEGTVGAVGQHSLNLGHDALAGNGVAQYIGNPLRRGNRLVLLFGKGTLIRLNEPQTTGDVGGDHLSLAEPCNPASKVFTLTIQGSTWVRTSLSHC